MRMDEYEYCSTPTDGTLPCHSYASSQFSLSSDSVVVHPAFHLCLALLLTHLCANVTPRELLRSYRTPPDWVEWNDARHDDYGNNDANDSLVASHASTSQRHDHDETGSGSGSIMTMPCMAPSVQQLDTINTQLCGRIDNDVTDCLLLCCWQQLVGYVQHVDASSCISPICNFYLCRCQCQCTCGTATASAAAVSLTLTLVLRENVTA